MIQIRKVTKNAQIITRNNVWNPRLFYLDKTVEETLIISSHEVWLINYILKGLQA